MSKYHDSTTDYSNRTVDLLLLHLVEQPDADIVVNPDVSVDPRITTGIEKLVQRFALLFLTQLGSVKNSENEGTEFLELLGAGNIYDLDTLTAAASAANNSVATQIQAEDAALDTPDDEALDTSTVTDLDMDRRTATVSVTVTLVSRAGDKYVYTMPLKTGV